MTNPRSLIELYNSNPNQVPTKLRPLLGDLVTDSKALAERAFNYWRNSRSANRDRTLLALQDEALSFHADAGTKDIVLEACGRIRQNAPILRIAHQPNIFPYLGVVAQFLFLHSTAENMIEKYETEPVELFLIVDYDVAEENRFRTVHYPDATRTSCLFNMSTKIPADFMSRPMYLTPKPTGEDLERWIDWMVSSTRHDIDFLRKKGLMLKDYNAFSQNLHELEELFWKAHSNAHSSSEFNTFLLSELVNGLWELPIAFARESRLRRSIPKIRNADSFESVLKAEEEVVSCLQTYGLSLKYKVHKSRAPFWYLCRQCSSRVPLSFGENQNRLEGVCDSCHVNYEFNIEELNRPSQTCHRFIPNVLLDDLLDIEELGICGGSSYSGGAEHILVSNGVAKRVGLSPFPQCVWRPRDCSPNTSEFVAAEMLKNANDLKREALADMLKEVHNGRVSMVYYLINGGITAFKDSWLRFLKDGDVASLHNDSNLSPMVSDKSGRTQS